MIIPLDVVVFTYSFIGVILSTAFVHLLQDAFDRLQDPQVKHYTDIGRWTGLIV
jgi:zinc transporter 1/2/3